MYQGRIKPSDIAHEIAARLCEKLQANHAKRERSTLLSTNASFRNQVGSVQSCCSVLGAAPPLPYVIFNRRRSLAGGGYTQS